MNNSSTSAKIIVELGGKQHVTEVGGKVISVQTGAKEGESVKVKDLLSGKDVNLKVIKNFLGEKINGLKFHSKSRYTRRYGHRQPMMLLEVAGEIKSSEKPVKKTESVKKTTKKPVAKKPTAKKASK